MPTAVEHLREALRESDGDPGARAADPRAAGAQPARHRGTRGRGGARARGGQARRAARRRRAHGRGARERSQSSVTTKVSPSRSRSANARSTLLGDPGTRARSARLRSALGHCFYWSGRIDEARRRARRRAGRGGGAKRAGSRELPLVSRARRGARGPPGARARARGPVAGDHACSTEARSWRTTRPCSRRSRRSLPSRARRRSPESSPSALAPLPRPGEAMSTGRFHVALLGSLDHWAGDPMRAIERFEAFDRSRLAAGFSRSIAAHSADHVESLLEVGRVDDARELLAEWEAQATNARTSLGDPGDRPLPRARGDQRR